MQNASISVPSNEAKESKDDRTFFARVGAAFTAAVGAVSGVAPHILHHVGPIAGAALLTGTGGTALFGAIGFVLTLPILLRLRSRFQSWLAPGIALAIFSAVFTVSTLWIGPAIRGDSGGVTTTDQSEEHDSHH